MHLKDGFIPIIILALGVILFPGCGAADALQVDSGNPQPSTTPEQNSVSLPPTTTPTTQPTPVPTKIKPTWIPTPSELPLGYEQSIPFDGIYPVYTPFFVNANDAPFDDEELVLGVAWDGEAKAYPITVLRFREMVNDELAGIPTLVTY